MSQHPYMWNGNNPVQYNDPSGYDTIELFDNQKPAVFGHAALFISNGHGDEGTYLCWCGTQDGKSKTGGFSGPAEVIVSPNVSLASLERANGGRYDTGHDYHTDSTQDAAVLSAFPTSGEYNAATNNCVQECYRALQNARIDNESGSAIPRVSEAAMKTENLNSIDNRLMGASRDGSGAAALSNAVGSSGGGTYATTSAAAPGGTPR
jgi:hypothetical protein